MSFNAPDNLGSVKGLSSERAIFDLDYKVLSSKIETI